MKTGHDTEPLTPEQEQEEREKRGAALTNQGDRRGDDGDYAGAIGEYKKANELLPESASRLTKLADSYAAMDVPHKAVEYYQRALQSNEAQSGADLSEAHVGLGDLCRTLALSAAAVKSYTRAVRSRPKNAFFRWKLGVALTATGLYDQAQTQFEAALDIAPNDAFYRFQLAELLMMMRRDEESIEQMQRSIADAPRDDYYRLRLGAALLRVGRTEEAVPQFAHAVRLQKDNASYRALLNYARARNGEEAEIAVDVDMIELGAYDEDYVKRIVALCQPRN